MTIDRERLRAELAEALCADRSVLAMTRDEAEHYADTLMPVFEPHLAALERARRGFDCPTCLGIGRTFHDDMPDGSTRAQGCLACDGTGRNPRGPAAALDRMRALANTLERESLHIVRRAAAARIRAALDGTEADRD